MIYHRLVTNENILSVIQTVCDVVCVNVHNQYTSWLDDVVSDTECRYSCRGRMMPGNVNHVKYRIQVSTEAGSEDFELENGKIKASTKPRDDVPNGPAEGDEGDADHQTDKMDIDDNEAENGKDTKDSNTKEWYQKLKLGDYVQCLLDIGGDEQWTDCKVLFINRGYDIQYVMRKSMNQDT